MGKSDILTIAGIAVLAYVVMAGGGIKSLWETKSTATSTAVTTACPRGAKYSRGYFGECDPNYMMTGWLDQTCECQSKGEQTPAQAKDAVVTASIPKTPEAADCDLICQIKKAAAAIFTQTPAQEKDAALEWGYNPSTDTYIPMPGIVPGSSPLLHGSGWAPAPAPWSPASAAQAGYESGGATDYSYQGGGTYS